MKAADVVGWGSLILALAACAVALAAGLYGWHYNATGPP